MAGGGWHRRGPAAMGSSQSISRPRETPPIGPAAPVASTAWPTTRPRFPPVARTEADPRDLPQASVARSLPNVPDRLEPKNLIIALQAALIRFDKMESETHDSIQVFWPRYRAPGQDVLDDLPAGAGLRGID